MRGLEIMKELQGQAVTEHPFLRWWRPENDFFDYDLVERFRTSVDNEEEFGGFELLTMEEMWDELMRVAGARISHYRTTQSGDLIEWRHPAGEARPTELLPYSAESMIVIYDEETRDNPVC